MKPMTEYILVITNNIGVVSMYDIQTSITTTFFLRDFPHMTIKVEKDLVAISSI